MTHSLRQEVDSRLILLALRPEFDLRQTLVGERIAHDKARVTHGAAEVHQTTLRQQDHVTTVLHRVPINLITTSHRFTYGSIILSAGPYSCQKCWDPKHYVQLPHVGPNSVILSVLKSTIISCHTYNDCALS